ncbi:hypothetical protein ACFE04_004171 [Oxalis oulophora]
MKNIFFCALVLDDSIKDGKLILPKAIVQKHGNILPSKAFLKVPTGDKWQVSLEEQDGRMWFGAGWPEFVSFYSIKHGYFLEFKFDGNMTFHVIVFHRSCTDIDYPSKQASQRSSVNQQFDSFTMKMVAAYINTRYMCIPSIFARSYNMENHKSVILQGPDGEMHPVKCRYNPHGEYLKYPKLFGGWGAFVKTYNIQIGDTCVFKLLDPETFTLQVQILKA